MLGRRSPDPSDEAHVFLLFLLALLLLPGLGRRPAPAVELRQLRQRRSILVDRRRLRRRHGLPTLSLALAVRIAIAGIIVLVLLGGLHLRLLKHGRRRCEESAQREETRERRRV